MQKVVKKRKKKEKVSEKSNTLYLKIITYENYSYSVSAHETGQRVHGYVGSAQVHFS